MSETVNYRGLDILTNKEPTIKRGDVMTICLYSISRDSYDNPFLEFLLHREDGKLGLPEILHSYNTPSNDCMGVLKKMFNTDKSIEYRGYISDNILFFETVSVYNFATFKSKLDQLWFVTVEEIINHGKSLHYDIDNSLTLAYEAKRKIIAAKGTRDAQIILSQGLTDQILKVKHIEALLKLAESPNAKIIMAADDTPFLID